MDAFTTWFKKRSKNGDHLFFSPQELVTRGPSRPTGSTYLGDLAGVSILSWGCGDGMVEGFSPQFLRPKKLVFKKIVPRWMTFFFSKKSSIFKWQDFVSFFCSSKGPRHHGLTLLNFTRRAVDLPCTRGTMLGATSLRLRGSIPFQCSW